MHGNPAYSCIARLLDSQWRIELIKKGKKSKPKFQNRLNITSSLEILHSSVLSTYLQQMLSHFQIVICQRTIKSGKDSGDLQSNTPMFDSIYICRYKNTHTQIHEGLHSCIYIYRFLQFLFVYLREKNSCYLAVESSNHPVLLRQHRKSWENNHTTLFQENLSKAVQLSISCWPYTSEIFSQILVLF